MKLDLSDAALAEIGKITVVFGLLEASLADIIGAIVTVGGHRHELGSIVSADLAFRQRISMINALLLFALPQVHEAVAEFNLLKPLLYDAEVRRNVVVHSIWALSDESNVAGAMVRIKTTAKTRGGLRVDFQTVDLADLKAIADAIGNAYAKLCLFQLRFQQAEQYTGE